MHSYMYARIKFHTYRDIISEKSVSVSRKRELQQIKDYQSLQLILETMASTSQAIDWGLRTPRTQQHLQKSTGDHVSARISENGVDT